MKNFTQKSAPRYLALLGILCFWSTVLVSQITVSGRITDPGGLPAAEKAVVASGTENKFTYTDNNGNYSFSLQPGGAYEIKPLDCRQNPLNGVTTYDKVLMLKHVEGLEILSPYKQIAADVDGNHQIDSVDIQIMYNLVAGIIQEFPADNYKYVLKNYTFPDPSNVFNPIYPNSFGISQLQSDITEVDFISIKAGDVNATAIWDDGCLIAYPAFIKGKVFYDASENCLFDSGEQALEGWNVFVSDGNNHFFGTTNQSGEYQINVIDGTYTVMLSKPNDLWNGCMDTVVNVFAANNLPATVDFGVHHSIECPYLEVELAANQLRRCFINSYKVQYCNLGTATAENAYVEVTLDPFFEFSSSTLPPVNLGGNKYAFLVGDVPSGVCDHFLINFTLSCDAVLGQTHCSEAQIFPDTVCLEFGAYTGADLHIHGECDNDEVVFTISNQGGDMLQSSSYIVIEDIVVMMPPVQNPFTLLAGQSTTITIPSNGTTVRLEANQPADHPWSDKASATVEGCGLKTNGTFSTGMVNLFPLNDQAPFTDIDCLENTGSFDPNDKRGIPLGVQEEHFIPRGQEIEYTIRFQNTGTDTAFTVFIRDTISSRLDPLSLRVLGSSHPVQFSLTGQGVAQFVFSNIMLPDSNINEPASHGFVKFSIAPWVNLEEGTRVENRAFIYFDFNEPIETNTTWHTFGSPDLVESDVPYHPEIGLEVYPNPTVDNLNFLLKSPFIQKGTIQLFNLNGALIAEQSFNQNYFFVRTESLLSGCYLYKIISDKGILASGKVVKVER